MESGIIKHRSLSLYVYENTMYSEWVFGNIYSIVVIKIICTVFGLKRLKGGGVEVDGVRIIINAEGRSVYRTNFTKKIGFHFIYRKYVWCATSSDRNHYDFCLSNSSTFHWNTNYEINEINIIQKMKLV